MRSEETAGDGDVQRPTGGPEAPGQVTPVRRIQADDATELAVRTLLDPARTRPVVAITTHRRSREPTIDPEDLAAKLAGAADIVVLETGEATWALSEALPSRLDVYDGAARIWWPGLTTTSAPYDHPLIFIYGLSDAEVAAARIVAAIRDGDRRAGRFGTWHPPGRSAAPEAPPPTGQPEQRGHEAPFGVAEPGAETKAGKAVVNATVTRIDGPVVELRSGRTEGRLGFADERLDVLASRLRVGQTIPVFVASTLPDGTPRFSTQALLGGTGSAAVQVARPARSADRTRPPDQVLDAEVTSIDANRILVRAGGEEGVIVEADVALDRLASDRAVGETVRVRRTTHDSAGRGPGRRLLTEPLRAIRGLLGGHTPAAFTMRGLRPDPWRRLIDAYAVGDIVWGRVCRLESGFVLVEVLPGAALLAPIAELDWKFVKDPSDFFRLGERVKVKILELDPSRRRGVVSIKQAYIGTVREPISAGPGQPPFLGEEESHEEHDDDGDDGLADRIDQLQQELNSTLEDRADLMQRLRAANQQVSDLRKEQRSTSDRLRALEMRMSGDLDPTASENAFLTAVRVDYARRVPEHDRHRYPLRRMRVGPKFLERLRGLNGIAVEKVVEVCAQVACHRAHEFKGREVHELSEGEGGAPARFREEDGAKAWRCSLQDNTASARRLHWWEIPGKGGRTIEFASVAVHDDFSIPS